MKQWEFKRITGASGAADERLREEGLDGWEPFDLEFSRYSYSAWLKRPIQRPSAPLENFSSFEQLEESVKEYKDTLGAPSPEDKLSDLLENLIRHPIRFDRFKL